MNILINITNLFNIQIIQPCVALFKETNNPNINITIVNEKHRF